MLSLFQVSLKSTFVLSPHLLSLLLMYRSPKLHLLGVLFVRSLRYPAGPTLRTCRGMAVKTFLTVNTGTSHQKFGPSLENSRDLNVGCKIVDCTALSHQLVFSGNKGASSASPVATMLFFSLYILITAWVIMVMGLRYDILFIMVIRSVQSSLWVITSAVADTAFLILPFCNNRAFLSASFPWGCFGRSSK